eukprot:TRINITY_DN5300_c0_g1_i1.p1 TRINITY_DN5300_c0_g1~~TRINITY_DN5300_c0_g1_i1.p1  ORF type:complete len:393 (+),score=68.96 TRINITY_DN5300_c0_g1_i1:103-1179(+)
MEHSSSMDNLLESLWKQQNDESGRVGSGFPLNSFLKQIPSTQNIPVLTSAHILSEGTDPKQSWGGGPLPLYDQANLMNQVQQNSTIPRVASLEFIKHLQQQKQYMQQLKQQHLQQQQSTQIQPQTSMNQIPQESGSTPSVDVASTQLQLSYPEIALASPQLQPVNQPQLPTITPLVTAASQIHPQLFTGQQQQLEFAQLGNFPGNQFGMCLGYDNELFKEDERRSKRMISNRESARRSRKRKQEHLVHMEQEIEHYKRLQQDREKDMSELKEKYDTLFQKYHQLQIENIQLKNQLEKLVGDICSDGKYGEETKVIDTKKFRIIVKEEHNEDVGNDDTGNECEGGNDCDAGESSATTHN